MTAEIALLNKTAVALAADSAMTLLGTGKIYPANKLFALSRYHPVGAMIYNNTEFMGVPWETLIKRYRLSIGREAKSTFDDYLTDFLNYIRSPEICTEQQERVNLLRIASDNYNLIRGAVYAELRDIVLQKKRFSNRDESGAIRKAVEGRLAVLKDNSQLASMEGVDAARTASNYRSEIDDCIDRVFQGFNISTSARQSLHRIFRLAIKSAVLSRGNSGIVIAEFGEKEMFPTLIEVVTDGVIAGKLKYEIRRHTNIGRDGTSAAIVPFAQSEMVQRFMEGVDPEFLQYLGRSTEELLYEFGKGILDVSGLANTRRLEALREAATKQIGDYFGQHAKRFRKIRFVDPVMDVVEYLPKEELAGMAEALVNLTSLKRRVSLEQETVGGPIDIAVISKGDGFVWIKRKHYFDVALNAKLPSSAVA